MLGMVNGGAGVSPVGPLFSRSRGEIYVVETVYSRMHRGERTDLVTIYDAFDLNVRGEVVIPPKRADNGNGVAVAGLVGGDRFLVAFNQTPAMSVSVVDLAERRFVGEIDTSGCALVYPAGGRRFGQLCGDGSAQWIELDEAGAEVARGRSEAFFDARDDPLTEKGARTAQTRWVFASFEGHAHEVDFSGERPRSQAPWSLFTDAEREDGWRVGGNQHLAVHRASGRLYSVVHQGERGSHKDGGPEVWVYDLAAKRRVSVVEPGNLTAAFLRGLLGLESGSLAGWLLGLVAPNEVANLAVSQDDTPLLYLGSRETAAVSVHDARSGEHLRDLEATGLSGGLLVVP